jgi:hypothetical protein
LRTRLSDELKTNEDS